MKKLTLFAAFLMLAPILYAGGLLTNTNQSAQFIRMMSRNASLDIDAVYFNPAGLVYLEDGWHFAAYSQTIFQTKPVDSKFPLLNDGYYEGIVNVPVFPTAYAVYKMEDWAFSLGFGPNAGGGSASYERGLPSFEIPITKVVPGLAGLRQINPAYDVRGYDADLSFEGSSVFWGIQLGATYQIDEMFSVYGGVRYLPAKNTYQGQIQNIQLKVGDEYKPAPAWLNDVSTTVGGLAAQVQAAANMPQTLQPFLEQAGGYTLAQLEAGEVISAVQRAGIEGGLILMGLSQQEIDAMNLTLIHGAYEQASPAFQQQATLLSNTSASLSETADKLADKNVDTKQVGQGFTPMIGVNFSPNENLNIALKYEMKTTLGLENQPNEGDNYSEALFGEGVQSDIPAIFAAGVGYRTEIIEAQLSYNMYFNKGVNWGPNVRDMSMQREIDKNGMEVALGLQFNVLENFAFSLGGMYGDQGIADSYQSDFSFSNPSFTAGAGVEWKITDALTLDAGASNTFYQDQTVTFNDPDLGAYDETYSKTTLNLAVGLSYTIFR